MKTLFPYPSIESLCVTLLCLGVVYAHNYDTSPSSASKIELVEGPLLTTLGSATYLGWRAEEFKYSKQNDTIPPVYDSDSIIIGPFILKPTSNWEYVKAIDRYIVDCDIYYHNQRFKSFGRVYVKE